MEQSSIDILAHRNPWMAELEVLALVNSIIIPRVSLDASKPFFYYAYKSRYS